MRIGGALCEKMEHRNIQFRLLMGLWDFLQLYKTYKLLNSIMSVSGNKK